MFSIRSNLRKKLLRYYFANTSAKLYVRELAQRLEVDPANLAKELRRLAVDGLFIAEERGNQTYYRLNRDYPLYEAVRSVVAKTFGVADELAQMLHRIPNIELAYLYGSFARGDEDAQSDIDLLVVGTPDAERLAMSVGRQERLLGRPIHYVVMTGEEFTRRKNSHDAFLCGVLRDAKVELVAA